MADERSERARELKGRLAFNGKKRSIKSPSRACFEKRERKEKKILNN